MKTNEENINKQRFVECIVNSMQMTVIDFTNSLHKGAPYEHMIHQWITSLYEEKVEIEEAITIIHQRRLQVLFYNSEIKTPEVEITKARKRVLDRLKNSAIYNSLDKKNKEYVHSKIENLIRPNLHSCSDIFKIILKICKKLRNDQKSTITNTVKPKTHETKKNTNNNMVLHNLITPNTYLLNNHIV